ncbi:MAG: amidohydrolase [Saprospiraceae bacterium]|nr:amidohydrolase [Saprospiraceae bacterium]
MLNRQVLLEEFQQISGRIFELYREINAHPELGLECHDTAKRIKATLKDLGMQEGRDYKIFGPFAQSGFAIVLYNGDGPRIMYRGDMDALILQDLTGLPFHSTIDGRHHGCGHQLHSSLCTANAVLLHRLRKYWKGTCVFLFQPGEEGHGGAEKMIAEGLYDKLGFIPDKILFTHVFDQLPAGAVGLRAGETMAGAAFWNLTITSEGGHAGRMASINEVANAFEDLFYKLPTKFSPFDEVLVNISGRETSSVINVNPTKIVLKLSARTYQMPHLREIERKIANYIKGLAIIHEIPEDSFKLEKIVECQPLISDASMEQSMRRLMTLLVERPEQVRTIVPIMSSEDAPMLAYQILFPDGSRRNIPILMIRLGVQDPDAYDADFKLKPGAKAPLVHTGHFAPTYEKALETGVIAIGGGLIGMFGGDRVTR